MSGHLDRALAGFYLGIGLFGAAAVTIAQGVLDDQAVTFERLIGGGALVTVAILIVRWSRQMSRDVRETLGDSLQQTQRTLEATVAILETERGAWAAERNQLRDERTELIHQLAETRQLLQEERHLRISLEKAGIVDRRGDPTEP